GGGTLTLRTGNIKLDAALKARFPDAKHSRYVFVEVSDTGPGIEPKLIDNIFEPFFTTKEIGAGAGLGLSLVYKIAKRHEGFVDVDSELGKGSKFTLFFPEKIAESREASTSNALPRGNETILIVDDEPHVRTVLRALLSKLGYEVLLVSDGEEAVETVRSHGDEIDLVLLDVVMPGMNGPEVFDAIRSLKPDCKVVISTGYAKEETVGDLIRQGAAALVRKPYRAATLSTVIRRVLDEEDNDGQIYG
ncbi:response regulator, partial [bacterium]|nr:response regulator [bacterium]